MNIIILLFYFPKQGDRVETIAYKPIVQRRTKELRSAARVVRLALLL